VPNYPSDMAGLVPGEADAHPPGKDTKGPPECRVVWERVVDVEHFSVSIVFVVVLSLQ
jgi:hypothetical protein